MPLESEKSSIVSPSRRSLLGLIQRKPEPWCDGPRVYMERPASDSWATLQKLVEKYDKEMCEGWKDDLDTMLVFTGLFSAAVTAFCVESFNNLSQAPADTTNALLIIISQQLANSSFTAATSASVVGTGFVPAKSDVQTNVLYFVSLALALSVSSVCILAKQWIREYRRNLACSSYDALRVRQARYDGLVAWKVPEILAALPVVLQIALLLFFAGLLVQLWNVKDLTTAIAVTAIVFMLTLVLVFTTVLPGQRESHDKPHKRFTPFRSPQAWILLVAWQRIRPVLTRAWSFIDHLFLHWTYVTATPAVLLSDWAHFDTKFIADENEYVERGAESLHRHQDTPLHQRYLISSSHRVLRWIHQVLRNAPNAEESIFWCINDPPGNMYPSKSLAQYVYNKAEQLPITSELVYYALSCDMRKDSLDSPRGKSQVEMLIRGANQLITTLNQDSSQQESAETWSSIKGAIVGLNSPAFSGPDHRIFSEYAGPDASRPLVEQEICITQIALLLKHLFDTSTKVTMVPTLRFSRFWEGVVTLLLNTRDYGESVNSQCILDLTEDLLANGFPQSFRNSKSVSIVYYVAMGIRRKLGQKPDRPSYPLRLFTSLDAIMVDWCSHPKEIEEGVNVKLEDLRRWCELRYIVNSSNAFRERLPVDYFDVVNGPLPTSQTVEE